MSGQFIKHTESMQKRTHHALFHFACGLETKNNPTILAEIHLVGLDGALFVSCLRACLVNKNPTIYVHVCPRPCLLEQAKFTTDKRKKD